ncbi:MAG: right-handed parallel beta-helix repeat-containing protein [Verrucomicrobiota bacterium]|nr:right-handed parallel beta-helix repeat-containing protein [Verrucomicrobiota bacterium]
MNCPRFLWVVSVLLIAQIFLLDFLTIPVRGQPAVFEAVEADASGTVSLSLIAPSSKYHRVERSFDLERWTPIAVLGNTNGPKRISDPLTSTNDEARFYRAVETDGGNEILGFHPRNGISGTEVTLEGQFLEPGEILVEVGGAEAEVVSSSRISLRIRVPEAAGSGPIIVRTENGRIASGVPFSATGLLEVEFDPPAGVAVNDYLLVNMFGGVSTNLDKRYLEVRKDSLMVSMAVDTNRNSSFYGVSFSTNGTLRLGVESTAHAFVMLSPALARPEPLIAEKILSIIRTNIAVGELVEALEMAWSLPGDPLTNDLVLQRYTNAVLSVMGNADALALAAGIGEQGALFRQAEFESTDYSLDLEFTTIETEDDGQALSVFQRKIDKGISSRPPVYNPVDWLYVIQEVDTDAAFVDGRIDFDHAWQEGVTLRNYPLKGDFRRSGDVEAELIGEQLNPVKYWVGQGLEKLFSLLFPKDETVHFPEQDGLYLFRSIGPGFFPGDELEFARAHYSSERNRAMALNLIAAVMDSISVLIDLEAFEVPGQRELLAKFTLEVIKAAPGINDSDDFKKSAEDLFSFLVQEVIDSFRDDTLKAQAKALSEEAKKLIGKRAQVVAAHQSAKKLSAALSTANKTLKVLDIAGGIGQVAQRVYGLGATTPMETGFILVGDPFKLSNVEANPAVAEQGEEVLVHFTGRGLHRMFNPALGIDKISFQGAQLFNGEVIDVSGTISNQVVKVRIPTNLGSSANGNYDLFVHTQGRKGSTPFRLTSVPYISQVTPMAGFAAVESFQGVPFAGTQIRVRGGVFTLQDTFMIGTGDEAITISNKSGSAGNITFNLPANAISGPLRIIHRDLFGEETEVVGPEITIWRDPLIESINPGQGAVGTPIIISAANIGRDPGLIRVQFSGTTPGSVSVLPSGLLTTVVPNGAISGTITVITPGGSAGGSFLVLTNVNQTNELGGFIQVGGSSVIDLPLAVRFAAGDAYPGDDPDISSPPGGPTEVLDPPYEQGDFVSPEDREHAPRWPIGVGRLDTIVMNGVVGGDADFYGRDDSISGGSLTGAITVSGTNLKFSQVAFKGPVTITGNSNFFSCTFEGPVTVAGKGNVFGLSTIVTGQMIVTGTHNNINGTFRNTPGHALILQGNWNDLLADFETNSGDCVRIEGGRFNEVSVNKSRGNQGNGVTLTGGAADNQIKLTSGGFGQAGFELNSGNLHGVAFLGEARDNIVTSIAEGMSGNRLDGVYLDGAGVINNRFPNLVARFNGRNGVTITNNAANNIIGEPNADGASTVIKLESNLKNGFANFGGKFNNAAVSARFNGENGALISGVKDPPSGSLIVIQTGSSSNPGNGKAALRVEGGTTGLRAILSSVRRDGTGLELDGTEVEANIFEGTVRQAIGNGVVVKGARKNSFSLRVEDCGGTGLIFEQATGNSIGLLAIEDNGGDGIQLIASHENHLFYAQGEPFTASIIGNRNGLVLEQGSRQNRVRSMRITRNRENGVIIDGTGTSANLLQKVSILESGLDGLLVRNGATINSFGDAVDNPNFPVRTSSIQDNGGAGVHVAGPGTRDFTLAGCMINSGSKTQAIGILIEDDAQEIKLTHNTLNKNIHGVVIRDGANGVVLTDSIFSNNQETGLLVADAQDVIIGEGGSGFSNTIYTNGVGVKITGGNASAVRIQNSALYGNGLGIVIDEEGHGNLVGPNNQINANGIGISLESGNNNSIFENTIFENVGAGIFITGNSTENRVIKNEIKRNDIGISIRGEGSLRNRVMNNSITLNVGKGIQLSDGGNGGIQPPEFAELQAAAVLGTSDAPDESYVQLFKDSEDEGRVLLGSGQVFFGRFRIPFEFSRPEVGLLYQLTATVTDPEGNSSEFNSGIDEDGELEKLAFTSTRDGNAEIYLFDPSSGTPINLTQNSGNDHSPALVTAGVTPCNKLLFVSDRSGNADIWVINAESGASAFQVTTNPAPDLSPEWLVPCERIVFVSEQDGNPEIYSVNIDGTGLQRLTTHPGLDLTPKVTANGATIIFVSDRGGKLALWKMNAAGGEQEPLISDENLNFNPAVSPDGQWVAFISERAGNRDLFVSTLSGGSVRQLTFSSAIEGDPAWSGDSQRLYFVTRFASGDEIMTISRLGGAAEHLTLSNGENRQPTIGR